MSVYVTFKCDGERHGQSCRGGFSRPATGDPDDFIDIAWDAATLAGWSDELNPYGAAVLEFCPSCTRERKNTHA